ncbi:E2 ubiquitin-protein ligase peroxin 4 [Bonamia ostreae]|uniref:E2 ubiquitin-protein ligase peroxin 4 n=1 Tax=Bonamia ostreae TaxID=126728 RepID=A0ABV2AUL8_9EUKA
MTAPKIFFVTKIFHPNVKFESGEVCLDILQASWSPVWSIESVCRAITLLLAHPEPNSPLNCDAGNLLRAEDLIGYKSIVRFYCEEFGLSKDCVLENN